MTTVLADAAKAGLMFAAIGMVAGFGAPLLAGIIFAEASGVSVVSVVQTALVFGIFGVLEPCFKAAFNFLTGHKETPKEAAPTKIKITLHAVEPTLVQDISRSNFRETIEQQRLTILPVSQQVH